MTQPTIHQILVAHLVDDYERVRTSAVRTIDDQVLLLTDGLDALRAGDTEVTEEYLDRAITALKAEAASLRLPIPSIPDTIPHTEAQGGPA
jgi:hypothetical protein